MSGRADIQNLLYGVKIVGQRAEIAAHMPHDDNLDLCSHAQRVATIEAGETIAGWWAD